MSGRVHAGGAATGAAVLTLLDTAGREISHTRTDPDCSYRLVAPSAGTYLLVCLPDPVTEPAAANRPRADWISLDGVPVTHDIAWQETSRQ